MLVAGLAVSSPACGQQDVATRVRLSADHVFTVAGPIGCKGFGMAIAAKDLGSEEFLISARRSTDQTAISGCIYGLDSREGLLTQQWDEPVGGEYFGANMSVFPRGGATTKFMAVVGAPNAHGELGFVGAAYIISSDRRASRLLLKGAEECMMLGSQVTALGDLNRDGSCEIAIYGIGSCEPGRGAGVLLLVNEGGEIVWQGRGMSPGDRYGEAVTITASTDEHVSGESFIAVAVPGARLEQSDNRVGRVDVLSVSDSRHIMSIYGDCPEGDFGSRLLSLGDVDQDGFNDVLVSEPGHRVDQARCGRVIAISSGTGSHIWEATGQNGWDFGGEAVVVGDVDGDMAVDVAVSSPLAAAGDGVVQVVSGRTGELLCVINGPAQSGALFGGSLAIGGQGRRLIAIGAGSASANGEKRGSVAIYELISDV